MKDINNTSLISSDVFLLSGSILNHAVMEIYDIMQPLVKMIKMTKIPYFLYTFTLIIQGNVCKVSLCFAHKGNNIK